MTTLADLTARPDDAVIAAILRGARVVAMVGASARPQRPSHGVMRFWQAIGRRVIPVNPNLAGQMLLGEKVRAGLRDISEPLDLVDVFRASHAVGGIMDDALAIRAPVVWLQLGVVDEAAATKGRAAGVRVVMDRCPKIEWKRLGL